MSWLHTGHLCSQWAFFRLVVWAEARVLCAVFCTGVAALAVAGLRGCDDEFFYVVFVVDEDVEQVRGASRC